MTTINDDRVLDARDMAEEMEQARSGEINGTTLREAAGSYARQFVNDYEFPSSIEHLQIQLQLAFNEGALWYNQKKLAEAESKLEEATKNLKGLLR